MAVGVKPGDEVISPGFSVMFNTTSTIHCNAIPVYADVDLDTYNIDPKEIEKRITDKTKAIQIVSIYGLPQKWMKSWRFQKNMIYQSLKTMQNVIWVIIKES